MRDNNLFAGKCAFHFFDFFVICVQISTRLYLLHRLPHVLCQPNGFQIRSQPILGGHLLNDAAVELFTAPRMEFGEIRLFGQFANRILYMLVVIRIEFETQRFSFLFGYQFGRQHFTSAFHGALVFAHFAYQGHRRIG